MGLNMIKYIFGFLGASLASAQEGKPLNLAFINDIHYNPFYKPKDFEETYHLF